MRTSRQTNPILPIELTEDIFMITYDIKEDFIEEHDCSNVVLSLYTTSAARINLLKLFKKSMLPQNVKFSIWISIALFMFIQKIMTLSQPDHI